MLNHLRNRKLHGFTLVELLITMLLGIIVTGGVLGAFLATSNSNKDMLNSIRLTQELRSVMSLITRDLRRAGSWNFELALDNAIAANPPGTNVKVLARNLMAANPFNQAGQITGTPACNPVGNDCTYTCVEYTYDQPTDLNDAANNEPNGIHDGNDEEFGFRLNIDNGVGSIQIRQAGAACADNGWQNITDDSLINITNFQIIDQFPEESGGVQIRVLEIRMTGRLIGDEQVQKDIVDFVRIRNDFF